MCVSLVCLSTNPELRYPIPVCVKDQNSSAPRVREKDSAR